MSGTESTGCRSQSPDAPEDSCLQESRLLLEGFVIEVLELMARRSGPGSAGGDEDLDRIVDQALERYLADRESAPPGWACLRLPESDSCGGAPPHTVDLDDSRRAEMRAEAERQRVPLETLVAHAVMYAWAAEREAR